MRPRVLAHAALATLLGACAGLDDRPQRSEPLPPTHVRVLTWNIHHGENAAGEIDLERIAAVIRSVDPDVVALQEVDARTARSGGVDQAAELARLTDRHAVFGANLAFQGGQYGNALLLRVDPEGGFHNEPLPRRADEEPRGALACVVPGRATPFLAVVTHLDHHADDAARLDQARALLGELDPRRPVDPDLPAILLGDLNDVPDSPTLRLLESAWTLVGGVAPTAPASRPTRRIDHVLVQPASRWRMSRSVVVDESAASDHRPVLCDLELRPPPDPARDPIPSARR